jgi:hypothetical protein
MKHVVETGTDVATVCFFDPAALPQDFDARAKRDAFETIEELSGQGRIWWLNTGADGAYLFHFYVNEEVPALIRQHSCDPQEVAKFIVPSGTVWACGVEYAARDPLCGHGMTPGGGLKKFDHMGGKFELPAGEYFMTAWRTEWPDDLVESEIEKQIGKQSAKGQDRLGVTTGVLFFGLIVISVVTLFKTLKAWAGGGLGSSFLWAWAIVILGWTICIPLMRKLSRLEKDPKRREVEREFPSIVVQMKMLTTN